MSSPSSLLHSAFVAPAFAKNTSIESFNNFSENVDMSKIKSIDDAKVKKGNYCESCGTPMQVLVQVYCVCPQCGDEQKYTDTDSRSVSGSVITITRGNSDHRIYTATDPSVVQKKTIRDQLNANRTKYMNVPGRRPFSDEILAAVVDQYSDFQQRQYSVKNEIKPFVKRANMRNVIIAALIKVECTKQNILRTDDEISIFMNLKTASYSRGTSCVSKMVRTFEINSIDTNKVSVVCFVDDYCDKLKIINVGYRSFIRELVEESDKVQVATESCISSKVVGAIWIVITKMGLKISADQVETATAKKRSTFTKFSNKVLLNIKLFAAIFLKYKIKAD